jgi:hypothetical protein
VLGRGSSTPRSVVLVESSYPRCPLRKYEKSFPLALNLQLVKKRRTSKEVKIKVKRRGRR